MKQVLRLVAVLLVCGAAFSQTSVSAKRTMSPAAVADYGTLPLSFEPNRGQTSDAVQWVARGPEYSLFLSGSDAVLELSSIVAAKEKHTQPKIERSAVRMNLLGAQSARRMSGEGQQPGTANYFTGNDPSKWQSEVPNFAKVRLSEVYPGIDLVYYGRQGRLEYDFVVAPGADASKIGLDFDGAEARLAANGDLVLPVKGTGHEIRFDRPTVYQVRDGVRQPVAGAFHLASGGTVSFELGSYDHARELVIDPTLLFAGSIATGNQQTIPQGMVIDATGAMYLTGYTNDLAFPVTTGALQTNCQVPTSNGEGAGRCGVSSAPSAFVTKLSADGTALVYSTYLHGGGGYEQGQSIAVDALGDAYVLGSTSSNDFPVTSNAYQSLCQPTYSQGGNFAPVLPITSQCDNFYDGGGTEYTVNGPNLFISKLNPTGTALLYSTFFGGTASVYPEGIALDAAGNIYFASEVNQASSPSNLYPNSRQIPFPTTATGYQTTGINALTPALSKLSADGQTLLYSTFVGSPNLNVGHDSYNQAFALGQNGVAFIGGFTDTSDFPTSGGAFKPACGLNTNNSSYCATNQGFVAAIDTTKSGAASLVYASYLGGEELQGSNTPEQEVYGLAADASNNLFVTGYTSANDFPSTAGVYQPHCNDVNPVGGCNQTAFLSKINPAGTALTWSTLLGDTRDGGPGSYGASIAFDTKGQVYLYGLSNDGSGDFPLVDPVSSYTGGNKVFLTTFSPDATQLLFSTRFSGPSNNSISLAPIAQGLAVDPTGNMYIVGYSGDGGSFGTTAGTYSTTATSGFNRPFFAKFSPITPQSATTLTIAPVASMPGQNVVFTVAVAGVGQATPVPTGTVALMNTAVTPAVTLGTITLDATGAGTYTTNALPLGSYSIVASYSGDANYEPSMSTAQPLTVTSPVTTNLLLNPGAELGSLQFWTIGGQGTPVVDPGAFDAGINPHTGSYDFLGHDSAVDSLSQTVSVLQEGITSGQVDGGTVVGQVSFWEQGLNQGDPSDDGSVTLTFLDGNNATISTVSTATVDSHNGSWANGTGTYAVPAGTRSITYTMNFMRNQGSDLDAFIDDNSLTLGTNTSVAQTASTTTLASTPAAPVAGQAVTFTVTVGAATQSGLVPTGTVTLMNNSASPATLGTITLNNGTGTFTTNALALGTYAVTATYAGDSNYLASASGVDAFTVSPLPATTTTLSVTSDGTAVTTVATGSVVTLTAAVTAGGNSVAPGQVAFCDASAATCTGIHLLGTAQLVGGDATSTATYKFVPGIGSHSYKAVFLGTTAAAGSASAASALAVTGKYATTTALASSGVQGSYVLTATLDGFGQGDPSGNMVFTDTSTNGVLGTVAVNGVVRSFVAGTPIPGGSSPNQVVSADVNGDGKLDLVLANQSGTMVTVLVGNGDGTYRALPPFGANYDGISGLAVGDFNGDGKLDIATANGSTVGIFLGNGDGTFGAEQDFANSSDSKGVYAADFNGDGKLDLAVTDNSFGITILIGNGDGTFAQPNAVFGTGNGPNFQLAVADFNKDGNLDIAYGNYYDNTMGVLLGNGDGTFQPQTTFAVGAQPRSSFVGDFNGDGNADIVLTNGGGASVSVLLGNGDGTFQAQQTFPVGSNPSRASVGDLNGDGKLDVAVANQNDGTVSILFGNGDGSFQTQQVLVSDSGTDDVAIGDVNGDGSPDLAAANVSASTVTVFLSQATAGVSLTGITLPGSGTDNVVATYSGDSAFAGSTSNTLNLASNQTVPSSTTLAVTPSAPTVGQTVTFSVAVAGTTPSTLAPAGTVTLTNTLVTPNALLGTITLGAAGAGTFSTTALAKGSYGVVAAYGGDANYLASMSVLQGFVVSQAAQTITFGGLTGQTYGAGPIALAATASSGLPVSYTVTGAATVNGAVLTITGAGQVIVTASQAGNATYAAATAVSQSFTVAQAVLTATAKNASRAFAAANPAFTYAITGFVNGDTAAAIAGTATLSTTATTASDAGTYPIAFATKGLTATNYSFNYVGGTLTVVGGVAQTITFAPIPNHTLGDAPFALSATASSGLAVNFAVVTGPATVAGGTVTLTGAGTVTIQAAQAGNIDYAAAATVLQTFTVAAVAAPVAASVSPAGVAAGSAATTVTLRGTNFTTTDVAQAGGTPLATTFINATTLTAVVPANLLAAAGTFQISIIDSATQESSGVLNFVVAVAPVVVFTGPTTATSDQQPMVTFQLKQPYAVPIDCLLTLTFVPATASGIDDQAVQFSTGGRTISFTVPAGSTTTPAVQFQTGTVAGTATVTLGIVANDLNVTPANVAPIVVVLPEVVPQVATATLSRTGAGTSAALAVTLTGFSNTREVKSAVFHFTPAPGSTLSNPDVTIDVTGIFATWFGEAQSDAFGSTFSYTQPFNLSADPSTIQSVTVTLINGVGSSVAQTSE